MSSAQMVALVKNGKSIVCEGLLWKVLATEGLNHAEGAIVFNRLSLRSHVYFCLHQTTRQHILIASNLETRFSSKFLHF